VLFPTESHGNGDVFFTTVTHDERNDLRSSRIMSLQYADGALRVTTRNSVYYMSSSDNKNMELIKNFFQESDRLKKLKN